MPGSRSCQALDHRNKEGAAAARRLDRARVHQVLVGGVADEIKNQLNYPSTGENLAVIDAIAAREDGAEAGAHGSGELWVACIPGITGMSEYYRDPESTAATVQGGWLRTGDMVRLDDDGYLLFHDRVKHMIKRAGENIAAAEVERVVNEHTAVFESAAVGVPDPVRDEQIKVYVVVREGHTLTDDELLAHCATFLAPYKVPSLIEFVEDLPRTSVGKIQKHRLSTASLNTPVP